MVVYGRKAKKKVTDRKKVCVLHLKNPLCVELYRFGPERRMLVLISHVINCGKRADWELRVNSSLCGTVVGSFLARMWMPWWLFHRPGPLRFFGEQYTDSPISRDLHTSRTESKVTDRKKVQRPPRESYGPKTYLKSNSSNSICILTGFGDIQAVESESKRALHEYTVA